MRRQLTAAHVTQARQVMRTGAYSVEARTSVKAQWRDVAALRVNDASVWAKFSDDDDEGSWLPVVHMRLMGTSPHNGRPCVVRVMP